MSYIFLISIFLLLLAVYAAVHALIYKKDPRAAFGWIAVCLFLPFFGPLLYFLFGINRVHTRAQKLQPTLSQAQFNKHAETFDAKIPESLKDLHNVSSQITKLPLIGGNTIEILYAGEKTYPSMLNAINGARKNIYLCVYIFKNDEIGSQFVNSLIDAHKRGVSVYVLIDGIGEFYSWKKVRSALEKHGIQALLFLPPKFFPFNLYINLRNHRKLLIIDDETSYLGGMNISDEYYHNDSATKSLVDIHFKIQGDITSQLKSVFESDWRFAGGKGLANSSAIENLSDDPAICRAITDGPGQSLDHLSVILLTAINSAVSQITLMTPYFLPSRELISALQLAALRGVKVNIILPEKNNLAYVHWASRHMLWELLERGLCIYYQPGPFAHSKLFVVDNHYSLIGSANIDPRSLRLNYEIGLEIYDANIAEQLIRYVDGALPTCRQVTLEEVDGRSLLTKIRDGIAWLFSPYL